MNYFDVVVDEALVVLDGGAEVNQVEYTARFIIQKISPVGVCLHQPVFKQLSKCVFHDQRGNIVSCVVHMWMRASSRSALSI